MRQDYLREAIANAGINLCRPPFYVVRKIKHSPEGSVLFGRPNEYRNKVDTLDTGSLAKVEIPDPILVACKESIIKLVERVRESDEQFPELPMCRVGN